MLKLGFDCFESGRVENRYDGLVGQVQLAQKPGEHVLIECLVALFLGKPLNDILLSTAKVN